MEERFSAVERLKRKHGGTVEAVLAHRDRCRAEIERLENARELATELERRITGAAERRARLASALTESRRNAARKLERRVAAELAALAMDGARLEIVLEPADRDADGYGQHGAETVELRVATNPGIPPSPLRDAASGGELSRVMLALSGLGPAAGAHTIVFDEIDAGIGADTAKAVGERLDALAEGRQLICITHLPQIASLASTHFRISKRAIEGTATATVEAVNGEELVAEIVRMLGGETGDGTADRHARELLAAA